MGSNHDYYPRFGIHLGPIWGAFWETFLEACLNRYVNCDMHEHINMFYGLAMSEPLDNCFFCHFWDNFWMLFRVRILGGLRDHILAILDLFWDPFWRPFWSLLGYCFCIDFRRWQRPARRQSAAAATAIDGNRRQWAAENDR